MYHDPQPNGDTFDDEQQVHVAYPGAIGVSHGTMQGDKATPRVGIEFHPPAVATRGVPMIMVITAEEARQLALYLITQADNSEAHIAGKTHSEDGLPPIICEKD